MRELVEHLPPGTERAGRHSDRRRRPADRHPAQRRLGAAQAGAGPGRRGLHRRGAGRALGYLVARTALVPLNSLTDTVEELAETTDVTRRLSPGGPDELGRLRRTFNRLLEALESSRRAQSQLVLDASHELRTPLTSLRTNLEVIRRVDELSAEDRSVLVDDVLVQLQELTDMVGDLAELARGDRCPASREPIRLDQLVQRRGGRAEHPRAGPGRALRARGAPCWVEGSGDRLPRAVGNLLDNARKWSPPGDRRVGLVPGGHGHRAGPRAGHRRGGPAPHLRPLLPLAGARALPGSGLGLAIVAQVVKAEGGTIVAENDPRGGARMTMRLPTVAGAAEPEPAEAGPAQLAGRRADRGDQGTSRRPAASNRRASRLPPSSEAILRAILRSANLPPKKRGADCVCSIPRWRGVPLRQGVESPSRRRCRRRGRSASVPAGASLLRCRERPSAARPWVSPSARTQSSATSSIRLPNGSST